MPRSAHPPDAERLRAVRTEQRDTAVVGQGPPRPASCLPASPSTELAVGTYDSWGLYEEVPVVDPQKVGTLVLT